MRHVDPRLGQCPNCPSLTFSGHMSWLRDHFHTFVFPAFLAAEKLASGFLAPRGDMGPPFDVKPAQSAPSDLPLELRKLWTLCKEHAVPWTDDTREGGFGSSFFRQSAQVHGKILRNTLTSAVVSMRAEDCSKLLFAGRDVWTLAVLAERRGVPYVFIPEVSRRVADDPAVVELLSRYDIHGDELLIDTGFSGSIPKALRRQTGKSFQFRLMSQATQPKPWPKMFSPYKRAAKAEVHPQQIFPNRKAARSEALETEYLAKYWKTGTVLNGQVVQYLSSQAHIQSAALLTSQLWRGVV